MLLKDKVAVIYGGGGNIGGAMARAFAREGAVVHLAGRTKKNLEEVADQIRAAGGAVATAEVDALDEAAVDGHADAVAAQAGGIDICVNLIQYGDVHGTPLADMTLEDFERPVRNAVRTQFLTTRAAVRHMRPKKSGVILFFGGEGDPVRDYYIGGFQVALTALEQFRRQLAVELGADGIRVLTLHTGGVAESLPDDMENRDQILAGLVEPTTLGRTATFEDVGNVAVFAASEHARTMTGATLNITCGAEID